MDNLAYKFTDTDLREDPALFNVAYNFLAVYAGEFEFLVHAKAQYLTMHELPLGTVRGVLNCMRTLPNAQVLLGHYVSSPQRADDHATRWTGFELGSRRLRVVQEDERPRYPFVLKATFKATHLNSVHKQAYKSHLLNPVSSEIKYYPVRQEIQVRVWPYCGTRLAHGVMMFSDMGREVCELCICNKEARDANRQA
jgi:hypothetical protein